MSDWWTELKTAGVPIAGTVVGFLILFGGLYGGALKSEDRVNNPDKYAKIILSTMLSYIILLIGILVFFKLDKSILETPTHMMYLFLGQSLFFLSTVIILCFTILNIRYG